jgi:type III restriction enzyme
MDKLYEQIKTAIEFGTPVPEIPEYVLKNLKYTFFDWQKEAFEYFLVNEQRKNDITEPTHLMFNMATGSGKTMVMSSLILYYYKQGYRHFLFFVNQNNIVDKTENNFIDSTHNKYLFTEKIVIDDVTIPVKKVDTFSDAPQGIEIKFTTVQKLYNDIHLERENQTTLEDLQRKDIVMLADEAHHLNANTKNVVIQEEMFEEELKGSAAEKEKKGWEHTVIEYILKKYDVSKRECLKENRNVLLEFTATLPDNQAVAEKYATKVIYQFRLKEFLAAGYTKEINLISSTLEKKERILQALLFQWYRHAIALKYDIPNFKPVVLFRSKTIEESKSDHEFFLRMMEDLTISDFDFLKKIANTIDEGKSIHEQGKSRIEQVLEYIKSEKIKHAEIVEWIQWAFQGKNVIITNSKDGTKTKEKTTNEQETLLNSLENKNNHIRAIFTVQRLTEGWDVLNLYDIVRLYEGRDEGKDKTGNRKAGSATIAEKQLIGRGVRYYPFKYEEKIDKKRKFDNALDHELRVLEELYFYSHPGEKNRYIDELKRELKKDGFIKDTRVIRSFSIKKEFQKSDFYKQTKVWTNSLIDNPNRRKKTLKDLQESFTKTYTVSGLVLSEQEVVLDKDKDTQRLSMDAGEAHTFEIPFSDVEPHIFRKAVHIKAKETNSLFQFNNLNKELAIESIDDLKNDEYLGALSLRIVAPVGVDYEAIKPKEKLEIVMDFLTDVFNELKATIAPKIGSDTFTPHTFEQLFSKPKVKSIDENSVYDEIAQKHDWFILDGFVGTSEEVALVELIENTIGNLKSSYQEVYLLRNEEVYKIYDFEQGRGFQPDFLLFLRGKEKGGVHYQVFIEPKQENYMTSENELWKEEFLLEISKRFGMKGKEILKAENNEYRLIGLPFYNQTVDENFSQAYETIVNR